MKAILTGATGTVGTPMKAFLQAAGVIVVRWNRREIPINSKDKIREFLDMINPDILFHLAANTSFNEDERTGSFEVNAEWPGMLAMECFDRDIRFVFTSTSMVFSNNYNGPRTVLAIPDESQGYGFEKKEAEELVMAVNPLAVILRLGWQIGEGKNTINHYLEEQMQRAGVIHASKDWLPSCSFLEDTVNTIYNARDYSPGIYHLNSNSKWNFAEIAGAMKAHFQKDWRIEADHSFKADSRLQEERIDFPLLNTRLQLP